MGEKNMIKVSAAIKTSFRKREGSFFTFFIDKTFSAFEGHFPGAPILPGIVQLEIALFCIKELLGKNVSVAGIKKAKFLRPIPPDSEILAAVSGGEGGHYCVTIKSEKGTHSQISLCAG
jgi:3-hydroxymyristoyl/3-hydroxydecanoyl-(acyl carrier protein) dehydratase